MLTKDQLPNKIMGKSLTSKVIPTVCNLQNMLGQLRNADWNHEQLKPWEKRSYKAYNIEAIKNCLMDLDSSKWPEVLKNHILTGDKSKFGASCVDIYLIAYVAHKYGIGKAVFSDFIMDNKITDKPNSVNAIWIVGKGDGVYLDVLNKDGSIKDYDFFENWIER
jgi:hypothetical protein